MRLSDPAGKAALYDVTSVNKTVTPPSRGIMVATAGDFEAVFADEAVGAAAVIVPGLLAGVVYPFKVRQINAAGTTAVSVCVFR